MSCSLQTIFLSQNPVKETFGRYERNRTKTATPFLLNAKLPHFSLGRKERQIRNNLWLLQKQPLWHPELASPPSEMTGQLSNALPHAGQRNCWTPQRVHAVLSSLLETQWLTVPYKIFWQIYHHPCFPYGNNQQRFHIVPAFANKPYKLSKDTYTTSSAAVPCKTEGLRMSSLVPEGIDLLCLKFLSLYSTFHL